MKPDTKYPAVLLTTGANDPRVAPWQAAKMAARLQASTTSGKPVLLRVDYDAGHGLGSTKSQRDVELADEISFLFWQLGVEGFQPHRQAKEARRAGVNATLGELRPGCPGSRMALPAPGTGSGCVLSARARLQDPSRAVARNCRRSAARPRATGSTSADARPCGSRCIADFRLAPAQCRGSPRRDRIAQATPDRSLSARSRSI